MSSASRVFSNVKKPCFHAVSLCLVTVLVAQIGFPALVYSQNTQSSASIDSSRFNLYESSSENPTSFQLFEESIRAEQSANTQVGSPSNVVNNQGSSVGSPDTLRNNQAAGLGNSAVSNSSLAGSGNSTITVNRPQNTGGGEPSSADQGSLGSTVGGLAGGLACKLSLGQLTSKAKQKEVPTADEKNRKNTDENKTKHCTLDGIAFALKEILVKQLISKIVGFANNGMEGGPSYMTNPDTLFRDVGDEQFENFINDQVNFSQVCSAWKAQVRLAVAMNYANTTSGRTLPSGNQFSNTGNNGQSGSQGSGGTNSLNDGEYCPANVDPVSGISDLSDGDSETDINSTSFWDEFSQLTNSIDGNPVTSYLNLQDQLAEEVQYETQKKADEVQRNQGYFDLVSCNSGNGNYGANPQGGTFQIGNSSCAISTPGQNVKDSVQEGLMSDLRRLELADEFDEVFAALIGMLISLILDQGSGGLNATTQRGSNGQSFIQQYENESNDTALIQSRQGLLNELQEYLEFVDEFIDAKRASVSVIYNKGILPLYKTQQCYLGKYNTVVDAQAFTPIPKAQYKDFTPQAIDGNPNWKRAVFEKTISFSGASGQGGSQTPIKQLLPPYGGAFSSYAKYQYYQNEINKLASQIAQLETDIAAAQESKGTVAGYVSEAGAFSSDSAFVSGTVRDSSVLDLLESSAEQSGPTVNVSTASGPRNLPEDVTIQTVLDIYQKALYQLPEYDVASAAAQTEQLSIALDEYVNGTGNAIGTAADLTTCKSFKKIHKQPYEYTVPASVNVNQSLPSDYFGSVQTNSAANTSAGSSASSQSFSPQNSDGQSYASNDWARDSRESGAAENPDNLIGTFAKMLAPQIADFASSQVTKTLTQSGTQLQVSTENKNAKASGEFSCSNGVTEDAVHAYIKRLFDTAAGSAANFIDKIIVVDTPAKQAIAVELGKLKSRGKRDLVVNRAALKGECLASGIAKEAINKDVLREAAKILTLNEQELAKKASSYFDRFAKLIWNEEEREALKNGPLSFDANKFITPEAAQGVVQDIAEMFAALALGKSIPSTRTLKTKEDFIEKSAPFRQGVQRAEALLKQLLKK